MAYPQTLQQDLKDMWALVVLQHGKCLQAYTSFDKDLAREVLLIEERVNSCEQFIEAHCRRYLATRAAGEPAISMVMFGLKAARQLANIAEQEKKMAYDVLQTAADAQVCGRTSLTTSFNSSKKILELACKAFGEFEFSLIPLVFARIHVCRDLISETKKELSESFNKDHLQETLHLFSIADSLSQTIEISHSVTTTLQRFMQSSAVAQ